MSGTKTISDPTETTHPPSRPGVLVIDDDDRDVHLLEKAFNSVDASVPIYRVKNGLEAISYMEGEKEFSDRARYPVPLLLLLDLGLPYASGLQVLKYLRSHRHLRDAVVVTLTGSSNVKDAEEIFELGVSSYLQKPQKAADFIGIVRNLRASGLI